MDVRDIKMVEDALECFIDEYDGAAPQEDIDRAYRLKAAYRMIREAMEKKNEAQ